MEKSKKVLLTLAFITGFFLPQMSLAQFDPTLATLASDSGLSRQYVSNIIIGLMQWLLYIVGTIAVIAFVISGIQYMTAAGSEDQIETAKRNMKWSIVGITVALSGLVIVFFVSNVLFAL